MQAHIQHKKVPITSEILAYDSSNFNETKRTRINSVLRDHFTPLNIRVIDERFPVLTAKDLANRKYQEFVHHGLERKPSVLCHFRSVWDEFPNDTIFFVPASESEFDIDELYANPKPSADIKSYFGETSGGFKRPSFNTFSRRLEEMYPRAEHLVKEELRKRMSNNEEIAVTAYISTKMGLPNWQWEQEDIKPLFNVNLVAKIKDVDNLLGMTTSKGQITSGRVIYYIYSTLEEFGMADFIKELTICSPLLDMLDDRHTVCKIVSLLKKPREDDEDAILLTRCTLTKKFTRPTAIIIVSFTSICKTGHANLLVLNLGGATLTSRICTRLKQFQYI